VDYVFLLQVAFLFTYFAICCFWGIVPFFGGGEGVVLFHFNGSFDIFIFFPCLWWFWSA